MSENPDSNQTKAAPYPPAPPPLADVLAGGCVRFAVAAGDGCRSGTWRVWTSKNKLDAYIAFRAQTRNWKVDLHGTGKWNIGYTEGWAASHGASQRERMASWDAPEEIAPGWRRGLTVIVPDAELRPLPVGVTESRKVESVPTPGHGYAARVEFFVLEPGASGVSFESVFFVAKLGRANGGELHVIARKEEWPARAAEWLHTRKAAMLTKIPLEVRRKARFPRIIIGGQPADYGPFLIDAAPDLGRMHEPPSQHLRALIERLDPADVGIYSAIQEMDQYPVP